MLDWNSVYKAGRDFGVIPDPVVDTFLKHTKPEASKTFLDIGCGTGQLSRSLRERGYSGLGIDLSEEAISIASSRNQDIAYRLFDIERDDIKLLNGPYGLITCKHVYAFISDKKRFLRNVKELLEE